MTMCAPIQGSTKSAAGAGRDRRPAARQRDGARGHRGLHASRPVGEVGERAPEHVEGVEGEPPGVVVVPQAVRLLQTQDRLGPPWANGSCRQRRPEEVEVQRAADLVLVAGRRLADADHPVDADRAWCARCSRPATGTSRRGSASATLKKPWHARRGSRPPRSSRCASPAIPRSARRRRARGSSGKNRSGALGSRPSCSSRSNRCIAATAKPVLCAVVSPRCGRRRSLTPDPGRPPAASSHSPASTGEGFRRSSCRGRMPRQRRRRGRRRSPGRRA